MANDRCLPSLCRGFGRESAVEDCTRLSDPGRDLSTRWLLSTVRGHCVRFERFQRWNTLQTNWRHCRVVSSGTV